MAKKIYCGIDNISHNIKAFYGGVNNLSRKIVKGYIGVGNQARQFWPPQEEYFYEVNIYSNDGSQFLYSLWCYVVPNFADSWYNVIEEGAAGCPRDSDGWQDKWSYAGDGYLGLAIYPNATSPDFSVGSSEIIYGSVNRYAVYKNDIPVYNEFIVDVYEETTFRLLKTMSIQTLSSTAIFALESQMLTLSDGQGNEDHLIGSWPYGNAYYNFPVNHFVPGEIITLPTSGHYSVVMPTTTTAAEHVINIFDGPNGFIISSITARATTGSSTETYFDVDTYSITAEGGESSGFGNAIAYVSGPSGLVYPGERVYIYGDVDVYVYEQHTHDYGSTVYSSNNNGTHNGTVTCASCGNSNTIVYNESCKYSEGTLPRVEPTCTSVGWETDGRFCTVCGYSHPDNGKEIPMLEHDWQYKAMDSTPATCTTSGINKYICSMCLTAKTETTAPLGHFWITNDDNPSCVFEECERCHAKR